MRQEHFDLGRAYIVRVAPEPCGICGNLQYSNAEDFQILNVRGFHMTAHPFTELEVKLNASDPDVQRYVFALKEENLKLQKQIAKYQAAQVTLNNRIVALEQEIKENRAEVHVTINP